MGSNERHRKRFIRQGVWIVIFLVLAVVGFYFYADYRSGASLLRVYFKNPDGGETSYFKLEIADNNPERSRGLMYRSSLDSDKGMIFVFPMERVQSFFMKNTYVPLDMIFVDAQGMVVGIVKNAAKLSETSRSVGKPSQYVVELIGGSSDAHGIAEGSKLLIPDGFPVSDS